MLADPMPQSTLTPPSRATRLPHSAPRVRNRCRAASIEARNRRDWRIHPADEEDETVALFEAIAAGTVSREELQKWLESHLES
jgi:hypothetical protein